VLLHKQKAKANADVKTTHDRLLDYVILYIMCYGVFHIAVLPQQQFVV
jgi:hypothetical protein